MCDRTKQIGTANNESGAVNSDVTILLELTARQKRIKELIRIKHTITILQMSLILSIPRRTLQRDLSILQKAGVIRHEGSDKSGIFVSSRRNTIFLGRNVKISPEDGCLSSFGSM